MRLFGTDGIRGVAGKSLTPELALRVGQALALVLGKGGESFDIFIGSDTRESSSMLVSAISAGICSAGANAVNLGVLPTPAVAFLTKSHGASAGVVISASHNSYEYNGIKIFGRDGYKLPDALEEKIEALCEEKSLPLPENVGICVDKREYLHEYVEHLREICPERLDGLRVGIDCANGASSAICKELFTSLGALCTVIFSSPNGKNINEGCGSTHLEALRTLVMEKHLDAGIAFDGDADRLMAIDEKGMIVDGDMIMASLAYDMKKRGALVKSTVVGTVMTNYGFEVFCEENGISFIPAQVGDRYVLEEMLLGSYCFGGEQSGHLIFGDYSTTGDGALSAIMLLSLMKRKSLPLSVLHSVMRRYPQCLIGIKATDEEKLRLLTSDKVRALLDEVKARLGTRGRALVRPSGTEPLIRIMVECESEDEARSLAEHIKGSLTDILN